MMLLYPAIDMKDGKCVRLRQGRFDKIDIFSDDPAAMAMHWQEQGALRLHVVDLDGALSGRCANAESIKSIAGTVSIPFQVGGGIRTLEDIGTLLSYGAARVIIGTKAVEDPDFVKNAIAKFGPERIAVGIDAKNGMVAVRGWGDVSGIPVCDLACRMEDLGVRTIIYTDILRDGMMKGPNIAATLELAKSTSMDVIASGGISCMEDLDALDSAGLISGAILGRSIYEGSIDLKEAIRHFGQ